LRLEFLHKIPIGGDNEKGVRAHFQLLYRKMCSDTLLSSNFPVARPLTGDEKGVCVTYTLDKTMAPVNLPMITGDRFQAVLNHTDVRTVTWNEALH
jgi:hypothetical protein